MKQHYLYGLVQLLQALTIVAVLSSTCLGQGNTEPKRSTTIEYINPVVPKVTAPVYEGKRYQATVPDTLDIAERARLAVNGLTSCTDPDADYEIYWLAHFQNNPPWMRHTFDDHVQIKFHEALPLMRLASGSRQNEEVDQRWMEIVMQMQGPDGLLYYPKVGRPWIKTNANEFPHYTEPWANGRLLGAVALYYLLTKDKRWEELGRRIVDGLSKQVVDRGNYAYFTKIPPGANQVCDAGMPAPKGWNACGSSYVCMGLTQFYEVTHYKPALILAKKLAYYVKYHAGILDIDGHFVAKRSFGGIHFHVHTITALALLEYGLADNDWQMVQFARKAFEFGITQLSSTIVGYAPEHINQPTDPGKEWVPMVWLSETCEVADMIALGLKLSVAGVGDYWDDVDRWTRNQFAESQLTSVDWVHKMIKDMPYKPEGHQIWDNDRFPLTGPDVSIESVPERCVGSFGGWVSANDWEGSRDGRPSIMHCCTGNGTRTVYYIWENILTCDKGKLKVNLLLNRASAWADVSSYIPYEGRVDVKVKKGCGLSIRIPEWVRPAQAQCSVNDVRRRLSWNGRYAVVGKVNPDDLVALTFPIQERTDVVHIQSDQYTLIRKGNDVVHIDPPGKYCPLYQREKYRQNNVHWTKIERYVSDDLVKW